MTLRILYTLVLVLFAGCVGGGGSDGGSDGGKQDEAGTDAESDTDAAEVSNVQADASLPATSFERPPYIAVATVSGQSIALIGAHSKPEAAIAEANWLDDVWEYVASSRSVTSGLILGDLNLGCQYASPKQLANLDLRTNPKFKWLIADEADTNVAASTCAYDRMIAVGDVFATVALGGPAKQTPKFSDHYPIGIEVAGIKIGSFNAKVFGDAKISNEDAVSEAATIVCSYDLTLVQEIVADDTVPADTLLARVNETCGPDVQMKLSDRVGSGSYKERFAYFFKPEAVQISEAFLLAQPVIQTIKTETAKVADDTAGPESQQPSACGIDPYVTPGGYCYATKDGKKKRVAGSCCGL